jgi:signal transduction histidine kinase
MKKTSVDRTHWRLRRRVFGSILVAGLVLGPLLLVAMWAGVTTVEDAILKELVRIEADRLIAAKQAGSEVEESPLFTAFWGFDQLREPFRSTSGEVFLGLHRPLDALGAGIYEVRGLEAFVAISPQEHGPLILFYDVSALEPLQELEPIFWGGASTVFALGILAVAFGLGSWLDRELLVPIRQLADAVGWDLETWRGRQIDSEDRLDEIGHLSRSIRQAALRLLGFLARERKFTRNASHELRGPLTVIQGATELLRARADDATGRPLERIERAVRRMESKIELFLFLAREEVDGPQLPTSILPAVEECLQHLPRRPDREHRVQVDIAPDLRLRISPEALRILLDNLIGNALCHGASGEVTIAAREDRLSIENPLSTPIEAVEELKKPFVGDGSGLGLAIVEDLCRRYGWSLTLEPEDHRLRVVVRLARADQSPSDSCAATSSSSDTMPPTQSSLGR